MIEQCQEFLLVMWTAGTTAYLSGKQPIFLPERLNGGQICLVPAFCTPGCWNNDIPVPWNELWAMVELGSWSILSTAEVVKTPVLKVCGHTAPILSKWFMAEFPRSADKPRTQSYETDNPNLNNKSTSSFDLILEWTTAPRKRGNGVSRSSLCLVSETIETDLRRCTQLYTSNCDKESPACDK